MSNQSNGRLSVFLASRLLDVVEQRFESAFKLTRVTGNEPLVELRTNKDRFDAVVLSLDVAMGKAEVDALPSRVRAVATYSVGTDHIDLGAARDRKIAVFNTPGVLADSVSENALFLMLGAVRRGTESIALIRDRKWTGWSPRQLVGFQLSGRTLGILGMGDIGVRIAARAEALGMKILYSNRRAPSAGDPYASGYRTTAKELVRDSDVLLLACPSTEETQGIVNAELLRHAKPELVLVNVARGDLVEDDALIDALASGRVWAAGLDVFAAEPNLNPAYYELPNVFMLPHIGSSTLEARMGMGQILIDALSNWQKGGAVANRVC